MLRRGHPGVQCMEQWLADTRHLHFRSQRDKFAESFVGDGLAWPSGLLSPIRLLDDNGARVCPWGIHARARARGRVRHLRAINHGAETSGMRARQPENYPVEVPAFTHAVAAGMIGRKLVGSPVVPVVLGPGKTPPRPLRLNRPARHAHTPHAACPVTQ